MADTAAKRWVDRVLPRTGAAAVVYFVAVIALLNVGSLAGPRLTLTSIGVASLAAGIWCALNFWRCRHAHCLVTGVGWSLLAAFCCAEVALGGSLIAGHEGWVFDAVLILGLAFEAVWRAVHGSNALVRGDAA